MRLIVELYDKVLGEYHAHGVSTSSRFSSIEAVPGTVPVQYDRRPVHVWSGAVGALIASECAKFVLHAGANFKRKCVLRTA
jgi:hypothetical protein